MKFTLNTFVHVTIFLVLSITFAIPITIDYGAALDPHQDFSPDGPHRAFKGSGLSVAGSDKRGLIAMKELHGQHRIAVDGSEQPAAQRKWVFKSGKCVPKFITHSSDLENYRCPTERLLPNGHCIPKIITRDAVDNSVRPVGQPFPICDADSSVLPCILHCKGPVSLTEVEVGMISRCDEMVLSANPPECILGLGGLHTGGDIDNTVNNSASPVSGTPICNAGLTNSPCIFNFKGGSNGWIGKCEEPLRQDSQECVFGLGGVHGLELSSRGVGTDTSANAEFENMQLCLPSRLQSGPCNHNLGYPPKKPGFHGLRDSNPLFKPEHAHDNSPPEKRAEHLFKPEHAHDNSPPEKRAVDHFDRYSPNGSF